MDIEASGYLDKIAEMNQTIDSVETVFKEHKMDSIADISLKAYFRVNLLPALSVYFSLTRS